MVRLPPFHLTVFMVALFSLLLTGTGEFANDPGVGWHLASGFWMLDHWQIPRVDPFLFSAAPRAWISDQWLSDLILASLHRAGGFALIYAVLIGVYLLTFFRILSAGLRSAGVPAIPATVAAFLAFKVAQVHFLLRPVIFGFFCFSILFALMLPLFKGDLSLTGESGRAHRRRLLTVIPPLFLVWTNLHPSFILGLVLLALLLLGFFLDQFFCGEQWDSGELRTRKQFLLALTVVCSVVTLINPWGYELHRSILSLGSSEFFMSYHQEWLSPDFTKPEGQIFELMLAAGLLALIFRREAFRFSMVDFVLVCFFVHATLDAVRFLPFFGMAISPYVGWSVIAMKPLTSLPGVRAEAFVSLENRQHARYPGTGFQLGVIIALIAYAMAQGSLPIYRGDLGPSPHKFPYGALLQYTSTREAPAILGADPAFGGFITWQGRGMVKPVLDDRNTMLGEEIYREYDQALSSAGKTATFFRRHGTGTIMVRKDQANHDEFLALAGARIIASDPLVDIIELKSGG